jgi:hypothetical protein
MIRAKRKEPPIRAGTTIGGKVNQTSNGKEHHRDYTALRCSFQEIQKQKGMTNMLTDLENKLLEILRDYSDDQREIILSIAQIIHGSPSFDPEHSAAAPASEPDTDPNPEEEKVALCGKRLVQTAKKADIPYAYDMNLGELKYLYGLMKYEGDPYNALCFAFDYGFVKGNRATRHGKVKAL